mmetsp:Transcript_13770/g.34373  ORF Transcript_13770/g.34373 Transcript_13770/m.34373 type:complete len:460 (+) Transcript_13770:321-1700(+)
MPRHRVHIWKWFAHQLREEADVPFLLQVGQHPRAARRLLSAVHRAAVPVDSIDRLCARRPPRVGRPLPRRRVPRRGGVRRRGEVQWHVRLVARRVEQQLVEAAGPRVSFGEEGGEVEERLDRRGHGGELELRGGRGATLRLLEDGALAHPRRDEHRGGAKAEAAEVEGLAAFGVGAGDVTRRLVGRHALVRRHDVVVVAARIVVRHEEQRAVPLGRGAQGFVHILEQSLAFGDVVARVVARLDRRVDPREGGEGAVGSARVEDLLREEAVLVPRDALHRDVRRRDRRGGVVRDRILAVARLAVQPARGVHEHGEADVVLSQRVVDGRLGEGDVRPAAVVVQPVALHPARRGRLCEEMVGRGGGRHGGVEFVEHAELASERSLDRDLLGREHADRRAALRGAVQRRPLVRLRGVRVRVWVAVGRELPGEGVVCRPSGALVRRGATGHVEHTFRRVCRIFG